MVRDSGHLLWLRFAISKVRCPQGPLSQTLTQP